MSLCRFKRIMWIGSRIMDTGGDESPACLFWGSSDHVYPNVRGQQTCYIQESQGKPADDSWDVSAGVEETTNATDCGGMLPVCPLWLLFTNCSAIYKRVRFWNQHYISHHEWSLLPLLSSSIVEVAACSGWGVVLHHSSWVVCKLDQEKDWLIGSSQQGHWHPRIVIVFLGILLPFWICNVFWLWPIQQVSKD